MVLSLAYLLSELDSKVKSHVAQLEKIDCKVDKLGKQVVAIENQFEDDIDLITRELMKRRAVLKETLWDIVAREDKKLTSKKAKIMEHINLLKELENKAFDDCSEFRELYGNAVEKSDSFNVGINDEVDLKLTADHEKMLKTIMEFGTINFEIFENGEAKVECDYKSGDDAEEACCFSDGDFAVFGPDDEVTGGSSSETSQMESACNKSLCDLSNCCNCVDICEETGMKIANMPAQPTITNRDWQQWLLLPSQVAPPADGVLLDNQLVNQLESLNLSQLKEATELNRQEKITGQFLEGLQYWLISKQRSSDSETMYKNDEILAVQSDVHKVWDEIKATPLFSWLKSKETKSGDNKKFSEIHAPFDKVKSSNMSAWLKCMSKKEEKESIGFVQELQDVDESESCNKSATEYEKIKSSPLRSWLQKPIQDEANDKLDQSFKKGVVKESGINFGAWLKRKHTESCDVPETETTKMYKKIKSIPLENWLKSPRIDSGKLESKSASASRAEDIRCVPLEMWLKNMKISENMAQSKYDMWLLSRPGSQQSCHFEDKPSTILQQFDKIASSQLTSWLKNAEKPPQAKNHDLCKWLKRGSLESCKGCRLACGHNEDMNCYKY